MKLAVDIGGVISKYPNEFKALLQSLHDVEIFVITDMHDLREIHGMLDSNGFEFIKKENVYSADYATHGDMCKAILLRDLQIDIMVDDFLGYLTWDSSLGKAPIRLLVQPDPYRSYWSDEWQVQTNHDFGRRRYTGVMT